MTIRANRLTSYPQIVDLPPGLVFFGAEGFEGYEQSETRINAVSSCCKKASASRVRTQEVHGPRVYILFFAHAEPLLDVVEGARGHIERVVRVFAGTMSRRLEVHNTANSMSQVHQMYNSLQLVSV